MSLKPREQSKKAFALTGLSLVMQFMFSSAGIAANNSESTATTTTTVIAKKPIVTGTKSGGMQTTIKNAPKSIGVQPTAAIPGSSVGTSGIKWQSWSDDVFKQSQAQHKLVILDLHAVWCHWCHVMDEKTYSDLKVKKLIASHFIPVSVDQDSRPDLANRYEDYGWPATIIFNSQGKELKLLSGFLPPEELIPELQSCIKSPDKVSKEFTQTVAAFTETSALSKALKAELTKRFTSLYDTKNGGWTYGQKYLPRENVEYAMLLALHGDKLQEKRAKEVLQLQTNLLDPVWGGMYQYSTDDDWKHAHFEKIMEVQAGNMRIYSLAYLLWKNPEHLRVAEKIAGYLRDFLKSPQNAYYTSQDADVVPGEHSGEYFALKDQARRKKGIPRIDKHIYARENGWVIQSLVTLYAASGEQKYLESAEQCANWIIENRMQNDRFYHDDSKNPQTFLGDNLSMGQALLALYAATGDRKYLAQTTKCADFIRKSFVTAQSGKNVAGFITTVPASAAGNAINLDENIAAARFFNLLYHYSSRPIDKDSAAIAMRYIATPWVANKRTGIVGGILLADREISSSPTHVVVVGSKEDPLAKKLFVQAQKFPLAYNQVEFFDKKEGKLPGSGIDYPELPKPAAFLCNGNACSAPTYTVEKLNEAMKK